MEKSFGGSVFLLSVSLKILGSFVKCLLEPFSFSVLRLADSLSRLKNKNRENFNNIHKTIIES